MIHLSLGPLVRGINYIIFGIFNPKNLYYIIFGIFNPKNLYYIIFSPSGKKPNTGAPTYPGAPSIKTHPQTPSLTIKGGGLSHHHHHNFDLFFIFIKLSGLRAI